MRSSIIYLYRYVRLVTRRLSEQMCGRFDMKNVLSATRLCAAVAAAMAIAISIMMPLTPMGTKALASAADPPKDDETPVGMNISTLSTVDLYGNAFSGSQFADYTLTVINLWSAWCVPCTIEMPYFQSVHEQYASSRVLVLGVLYEDQSSTVAAGQNVIETNGYTYRTLRQDAVLSQLCSVNGHTPQTFFVDSTGNVVDWKVNKYESQYEFTKQIDGWLALLGVAGDADCDGSVRFSDVSTLYMALGGGKVLSILGQINADVNTDGQITFSDVSYLYASLINSKAHSRCESISQYAQYQSKMVEYLLNS